MSLHSLPCALSLLYSPFLLYVCFVPSGQHISVGILERTFIHSTNTSAAAIFLLKPKPSPNPVTTPCFYSPQCMAGQALPCVCRTAQDARHFSAQECLELPLTLEHISQQGVIASLCTFAWILLDIILHVRKSLEYRAVAALSSSLS